MDQLNRIKEKNYNSYMRKKEDASDNDFDNEDSFALNPVSEEVL